MPSATPEPEYVELHCHSNYSFQEGASSIEELVLQARDLGYRALALTDHDNLCGAMSFARTAGSFGLRPITGAEVTLSGGGHLTLLATSARGYANLCRLLSISAFTTDRRRPEVDPRLLPEHAEGLVLLTGCPQGPVPALMDQGDLDGAARQVRQYVDWFGEGNVYLEAQQNLVHGDTQRIRRLAALGREQGVPLVATNNVHYHVPDRHRLQDCLVAVRHRKSLEESHRERRANAEFHLKPPALMARLFRHLPEALRHTLVIAERCGFDLTRDLTYRFPDYPVPEGFTPLTYLERLCREAALRRYGRIDERVEARLREELRLIGKHHLAGFLLIYHDIIQLAREVQIDLGLIDPEVPLEEAPPGRGRGSSVAMLVGYLIGMSHIDPLRYDLSLERFLPEELAGVPDIDLDFPRNIREELIKRVHAKYGWDHAALTGMIATYQIKGAIRDLGLALGLPADQVDRLAKGVEHARARDLRTEMLALPEFRDRVDAPVWRDLIDLAAQLDGFPRTLAQHPGGMIISSTPLIEQVPVRPSAIEGRYVCHWDKDSIDDAGFVKIDFLSLGALSQMQEAVRLVEEQTGEGCDLSRIDFEDPAVYDMIERADTIGIFQIESAAQMQTVTRIRPRNLVDMAHEVGAVRPGVGVNDGVTQYIQRRTERQEWDFDHPLEKRALERTYGVILFQDQVNQVAKDVAGFSEVEADQVRRAFLRRNNERGIAAWREKFIEGAAGNGVGEAVAGRIFAKFNGQYMFPESHAFAFGVTAYQAAWLKRYHPLAFYVGLFNEQPMGFYNLETLKEDAQRHGVGVLHPDVNRGAVRGVIEGEALRLGLLHVRGLGEASAAAILRERERGGPFATLAEFMERTGLKREVLEHLADAGALDGLSTGDRRRLRWEIGLRYRPVGPRRRMHLPVEQDMAELPAVTPWERMAREYRTLGLHPAGHLMAYLREMLPGDVLTSWQVERLEDGAPARVAGLVIRRQRPLARAVFLTLEDECGHTPVIVWSATYRRLRHVLGAPVLLVSGTVSRRDGTMNIVLQSAEALPVADRTLPRSKDWG